MANTPNIGLTLLDSAQAQKHVTMNESLYLLDTLLQLSVINRTTISPPASPAEGDTYVIPTGASGAWSGEDTKLANFSAGDWAIIQPKDGWMAWIAAESTHLVYAGGAWLPSHAFQTLAVSFPTVSGGVLAVTTSYAVPAPETGITDDIDSIVGGYDGTVLVLSGTAGNTLTINDGGTLKLGAVTRVLDNFDDTLTLIKRGTDWLELSFSDNG